MTIKKRARINSIRHILNAISYDEKSKEDIFKVDRKIILNGAVEIENMEQSDEISRNNR